MIRLIVGLGNPGPEYEATRHNAGFWWVEEAAKLLRVGWSFDRSIHGNVARASLPDGKTAVWLLQPMTFMNLSGKAVGALARFYKIAPQEILVVHDELDLPPGQVKLKLAGSAAGHNGLKDIQTQLGGADFWRLRLGIGHPGARSEVTNWVLRMPSLDERLAIDESLKRSLEALPLLLAGQMDQAMLKIHARPPRPKPPRPSAAPSAPSAPADAVSEGAAGKP